MAKLLLICPGCRKKLETDEGDAGREGQCPYCQKVFPITVVQRGKPGTVVTGGGWLADAAEYEYQEMGALIGVGAIAVCLLLLIVASLMSWVKPTRVGSDFLPFTRLTFLTVSAACLFNLGVAFAARKSLVPAALSSSAWGLVAFLWAGGILHTFYQAIRSAVGTPVEADVRAAITLSGGIYMALVAAILTVAAGGYFYFQCRQSDTFRRAGLFLVATHAVAVLLGVLIVAVHVKPMLEERLPKVPAVGGPRPQAEGLLPPATSGPRA
ncbi:MAG: hypothetical protein AMK73_02860 [Planctomycetes bacterium SM23_32]|nr:MAG: hypothetical protein AMK73_02860 [Planctomycetes bacterium SM23_32]